MDSTVKFCLKQCFTCQMELGTNEIFLILFILLNMIGIAVTNRLFAGQVGNFSPNANVRMNIEVIYSNIQR